MNIRNRGFSMVELMVAMVIGLMMLAAISTVLVNSKKNYTTQDSLSRLQENARFAMQLLTRDLRMAGYFGCADEISSVSNLLNPSADDYSIFNTEYPVEGSESGTSWKPTGTTLDFTPLAGTDALAIRYLTGDSVSVIKEMPSESASAQVALDSGLKIGDVVMIADCTSADIFQITGFNAAGGFDHVVHNTGTGTPGNDSTNNPHKFSKAYGLDAKIMRFNSVAYYIRNNDGGQPALYRRTLITNTGSTSSTQVDQELVEGIEDLEILYGIDSVGEDDIPDAYKTATAMSASDWKKVVAVRFGIVVRALANADNQAGNEKQYGTDRYTEGLDVDGDPLTIEFTPTSGTNDRYQRRVFRTTVVMRNLQ
jgi:type IV pilus assembly protein PilW